MRVGLNKLGMYKRSMSVLPLFLDDIIYVEYPSQFMYFFTNLLLLSNARLFLPATLILSYMLQAMLSFSSSRRVNIFKMYSLVSMNMVQKRIEPVWLVTE